MIGSVFLAPPVNHNVIWLNRQFPYLDAMMASDRILIWAHLAFATVLMALGLFLLALRNHESGMAVGLISLSMFLSCFTFQKLLERIETLEKRGLESADISDDKQDDS